MSTRAPNILFLMSDQMGAPVLPIHGHPVCQAPQQNQVTNVRLRFRPVTPIFVVRVGECGV